jgi:osmotically-inducible protein OsmY
MTLTINIDVIPSGSSARSDIDIARMAEEALRWVSYMPKDSVRIVVENGWITLSGKVDWDYQRRNAVNTVRHLCGVKGVSNLLQINAKSHQSTEIRLDIEAALDRHSDPGGQDISVTVRGSDVTLTGTVANWWQLDSACAAAWNAPGVQHVANKIIIAA